MRILYTFLLYLATPFILLRLVWRSFFQKAYRQRLSERFAFFPLAVKNNSIWIHAVSVGETHAAFPLIRSLLKKNPRYTLVVTTTTPTGSAEITKQFSDQVIHVYTPYDLPSVIKRFLRKIKPKLIIIMETELWPNLLHYAHKRSIPILLANARLSERSMKGYRHIQSLTKPMLNNITTVAAQSKKDGERFCQLGLDPKKLIVNGNIKFDTAIPADLIENANALRAHWEQRPTWIAASTHEGEEKQIIQAHQLIQRYYPNALLILVPRHPERFNKVAALCENEKMKMARRSLHQLPCNETQIYLGDTMGELRLLYAASDIAFVGGSLMPIGGHNPIEPALLRLPIIMGPHCQNFIFITDLLVRQQGLRKVRDAKDLAQALTLLFKQPDLRQQIGESAYKACIANTGALEAIETWVDTHLTG